jgi:hypothetical protein
MYCSSYMFRHYIAILRERSLWEMLNWGAVDRILRMGVLCLMTWCVAIWDQKCPRESLLWCINRFWARGTTFTSPTHNTFYIKFNLSHTLCVCAYYVGWLLAGLEWNWFLRNQFHTNLAQNIPIVVYNAYWRWASKCSKHVEAINRNKLKANSGSCWSYCADNSHKWDETPIQKFSADSWRQDFTSDVQPQVCERG